MSTGGAYEHNSLARMALIWVKELVYYMKMLN